jgi:trehalose 6-phosphate synthase/phosphatase
MNIVSYRGPGMAGGVSSALARLWDEHGTDANWWHLTDREIKVACGIDGDDYSLASLPEALIKGHYNYCNEFIWPVMHDLPQFARYVPAHREQYHRFNEMLGRVISHSPLSKKLSYYFVQDYQLALVPQFLRRNGMGRSSVFWHIPWPQGVREDHVTPMIQIAKGMLNAEAIGFHVQEYGENFLNFVQKYLPEYVVDTSSMTIRLPEYSMIGNQSSRDYAAQHRAQLAWHSRTTQIVTAPLGLDFDHWHDMANSARASFWLPSLQRKPYILSVDRADYTKGVSSRLRTIDTFFEKYPQYRGEVTFAQICGRTRPGISSFDNYWNDCKALDKRLGDKWQTSTWSPLLWLEKSFSAEQLSLLYKNAAVMLVNPVRDGLNLTAKEYVASQGQRNGVLALSRGAGVWHELGDQVVEVNPHEEEQMADQVHRALEMQSAEKIMRMDELKDSVRSNGLEDWWRRFSTDSGAETEIAEETAGILREIS